MTGHVGDHDPFTAITSSYGGAAAPPYDEVIVSTLSNRLSRWLRLDLVSRAESLGVPVTHVEAIDEPASIPTAIGSA